MNIYDIILGHSVRRTTKRQKVRRIKKLADSIIHGMQADYDNLKSQAIDAVVIEDIINPSTDPSHK